jgi:hypothetical protein
MRISNISKLILLLSVGFIQITIAQESQQQTQLQTTNQNIDDTSLFREVENAIDEDSEQDDAYRILKSLQGVTEEDDTEEEDDEETTEDDDDTTEEENIIIERDNDDDEEQEEEEDDDDFTPEFPEFQNEETTDFFEHLPQQPMDHAIDNQFKDDTIDDIDEDMDELTQPINEEEDDDDEEITKETTLEHVVPSFPIDNIPWQRPDPVLQTVDNSNFYQDINFKPSEKTKLQHPQGFKIWHILVIFLILVIIYRSSFKRGVSLV